MIYRAGCHLRIDEIVLKNLTASDSEEWCIKWREEDQEQNFVEPRGLVVVRQNILGQELLTENDSVGMMIALNVRFQKYQSKI